MKPIIRTALGGFAAALVLTGTVAAKPSSGDPRAPAVTTTDGAPVELATRPGSDVDRLARQLMAREIQRSQAHGEEPRVLVGMGRLNDEEELLFVQLQSPNECRTGACSTVAFRYFDGKWVRQS